MTTRRGVVKPFTRYEKVMMWTTFGILIGNAINAFAIYWKW